MTEKILIIDDEPDVLQVLSRKFSRNGYEIHTAGSGEEGWKAIGEITFDLVISDMAMDRLNGLELLKRIRSIDPILPFIVITGVGTIGNAVEAIKLGAFQYITKPFNNRELEIVAQRAIEYGKLNRQLRNYRHFDDCPAGMVVGTSISMQDLMRRIGKISDSTAPVLLQGETGTGKSLLAEAIHNKSDRKQKPFVTVDCASLTSTLLESELFGHVKGAFTGAIQAKRGLLEDGHGGTVFVDEVGELAPELQVKLLRAIQEKVIKPVGGNKTIKIDVRFISATSRDLEAEVKNGSFRQDLYYRLSVFPFRLPPLRERSEDIPLLVDHFVSKFCRKYKRKVREITPDVIEFLMNSAWKGNIRELANTIERCVLLEDDNIISMDSLIHPDMLKGRKNDIDSAGGPLPLRMVVEKAEKKAIEETLRHTNDNRSAAARILDINRKTLYDKISYYNISHIINSG